MNTKICWIKTDQLDVTRFIISLFTAHHVSNVSTSIFRSLRLILDLFHVLYCSGSMCVGVTVWFVWGGEVTLCRLKHCFSLHKELSSKWWNNKASDIKLVYLYSTIKMMHGPINMRLKNICLLQLVTAYRYDTCSPLQHSLRPMSYICMCVCVCVCVCLCFTYLFIYI